MTIKKQSAPVLTLCLPGRRPTAPESLGLLQRCDLEQSSETDEKKKDKKTKGKKKQKFDDKEVVPLAKGHKKDEDDGSDSGAAEGDDSEKPKKRGKNASAKKAASAKKGKSKKTMKEKKKKPGKNQADLAPGSLQEAMAAMEKSEEKARQKTEVNLLSEEEQEVEEDSRFLPKQMNMLKEVSEVVEVNHRRHCSTHLTAGGLPSVTSRIPVLLMTPFGPQFSTQHQALRMHYPSLPAMHRGLLGWLHGNLVKG